MHAQAIATRSHPFIALLAAVVGLSISMPTTANGDVLLIDRIRSEQGLDLPKRGERMATVRARFGEPTREIAAVGGGSVHTPPITRWVYPSFTVYFEHQFVINAVVNKAGSEEIGPKPVR